MGSKLTGFLGSLGCLVFLLGIGLGIFLSIRGSILIGIIFGIIILFASILIFAKAQEVQEANREAFKLYIASFPPPHPSFYPTRTYTADSLLSRIALDERNGLVTFWQPTNKTVKKPVKNLEFTVSTYSFQEIVSIELIVNGETISSSLSRESKQETAEKLANFEKISLLDFKVMTRDQEHLLILYYPAPENGNSELAKDSEAYKKQVRLCLEWYTILGNMARNEEVSSFTDNSIEEITIPPKKKEKLQDNFTNEQHIHLQEEPLERFDQAIEQIKKDYEESESKKERLDPEPLPTSSYLESDMNNDSSVLDSFLYESPSSTPTEESDPFGDFEQFLESNKQKQKGTR